MKTNHSASGHQLVSCTQKKGFAPYIHIYSNIHMYTSPRPKYRWGTPLRCPSLHGLKNIKITGKNHKNPLKKK